MKLKGIDGDPHKRWSMWFRMKLKGIDGDPHKRWSMWFNSKQREEPYQILTSG